ncbi:hypothetical protein M419DRAFT_73820 [Trichoderma reesei RUT C-30]|uniref:Uncharacterized protein n=1 Tax=Hypocrea jecorina (strain ATCC 56765 / BCRC 32924 / NRRL 11460 / Rut C-30) TaxID=1344414 RepID=A0A024SGL2_HYPJR|nr:hypothetical protein M419DRAFT_73820 [Trichoderma reesei RUT C-30]
MQHPTPRICNSPPTASQTTLPKVNQRRVNHPITASHRSEIDFHPTYIKTLMHLPQMSQGGRAQSYSYVHVCT